MLGSMIDTLIGAWFLEQFGFGDMVITSLHELFGVTISISTYYFMAAVLGLVLGLIITAKEVKED